ncbi:DEAD/DEAH box helicase [Xanthomonas translucens]|nr:DEAD/DEAH box helicase [Xanthomonas translucens]
MLNIVYRPSDLRAVIAWAPEDEIAPWFSVAHSILVGASSETINEGGNTLTMPWWSFVVLRPQLYSLFTGFNMRPGDHYTVEAKAVELLKASRRNTDDYEKAKNGHRIDVDELNMRLAGEGFSRQLTEQQLRNVRLLAALPAAATFSVPGAGKTTEALATFAFRRKPGERLLVIAPKNAFAAWEEQLAICFPKMTKKFVRLRGPSIAGDLQDDPEFMLISYQQLPRVRDRMAQHLSRHPTHVFLDESHRIKGGASRSTAQAVLYVSQLPVSKLVMSGTPMPQSNEDLVPQFSFLYPEIPVSSENVIDLIQPIHVRTNKSELGLPEVTRVYRQLTMTPLQAELYGFMKSAVAREASETLSSHSKAAFRSLGRSVARLLQFVSNPALLSREIEFAKPGLLGAVLAEGHGPKMAYVLHRARELAKQGQKVLVWSSWVNNVEYIADSLQELGAVYIHGQVDAGDDDDDTTREGKIKLFHDDPRVMVMVANPAAASEGISLHAVCHHAIYLDRTFNAAHYLQSEDRIHRLGLSKDQATTIELVECVGTVDEAVRTRLSAKVRAMGVALNDSGLRIDPVRIDPDADEEAQEWLVGVLDVDDVHELLKSLTLGDV